MRFNSHIRKIINSRCFPCTSLNFLINTAFLERLTVRELILSEVHKKAIITLQGSEVGWKLYIVDHYMKIHVIAEGAKAPSDIRILLRNQLNGSSSSIESGTSINASVGDGSEGFDLFPFRLFDRPAGFDVLLLFCEAESPAFSEADLLSANSCSSTTTSVV